jgi:hypothetical protein
MGEILGLGITHYPGLTAQSPLVGRFNATLKDPGLPDELRNPENWNPTMRAQWGDDEGLTHSEEHRHAMIERFRIARQELDDFQPDVVVMFGDDQYENFKEDIVPPFAILAYDEVVAQPWLHNTRGVNWWNEPDDKKFTIKGHRKAGKYLATALLGDGIDVAYAYKPLHSKSLGHAFLNSILYLDFDRKGFPYPIVPLSVNSYGRWLVKAEGRPLFPSEAAELFADEDNLAPPPPQPWRCFQLGQSIARAAAASHWKVAIIASSSWSHSFLTAKNSLLFPDVESDKRYFEALCAGDWDTWRNTTIEEAEDRGHHELLNWFCLAGAMSELDRKPTEAVFMESWISNSNKTFATFRP